jgi:hypothetical protein
MAIYGGLEFPEPEIRLSTFELLAILEGRPMAAQATSGQQVTVRLITAGELLQSVRESREKLPEDARPPMMTASQANGLTKPLKLS